MELADDSPHYSVDPGLVWTQPCVYRNHSRGSETDLSLAEGTERSLWVLTVQAACFCSAPVAPSQV